MASKPYVATLVPIKNMDRALKFYTKTLGAKMGDRGMGEMKDGWASVHLLGHELWLIAPGAQEKRKLAYTTMVVPNIKRFVKKLTDSGVKFAKAERMGPDTKVDGPIATESFGASAFFNDSEGNLWMVWQNFPPM